ncbi:MAG: right-handed parallel beta-helix repeat-containing protein [Anaerolineae bacterium]|nr:right-handed parallel beta-helix repeat-containing protein [Anaerolineae bacterium]
MNDSVIPVDGMVITEDTRLAPGVYTLREGLKIGADGVTLEGSGALLVNPEHEGAAVQIDGRRGVTVRGLSTSGFAHGIRADHCRDLTIEQVRVRDTAEIEGIDTFLYLWLPIEQVYSAAILLHDVQGGVVRGGDLQHQMNGILLYACSGVTVEQNNASFNSGWGVYLSGSNDNVIQDNRLDFCNRVYRRPENGLVRVEADAAGIVMVMSSCRNKLLRNSCLCGGDGIFIAGCTPDGERTTCDDNLIEDNDCRLSPNNAIESTFSRGNVFRRNDCSRSNYGFWMGYSWDNVVEDNHIEFNRWVGIAIEHGHNFAIRNNRILTNGEGIRLFTRGGLTLQAWQGWEVSFDFAIDDNLLEANRIAFNAYTGAEIQGVDGHGYTLRRNTFRDNRIGARFLRVHDCLLNDNTFTGNVEQAVLLVGQPGVTLGDNQFAANHQDVGAVEA